MPISDLRAALEAARIHVELARRCAAAVQDGECLRLLDATHTNLLAAQTRARALATQEAP